MINPIPPSQGEWLYPDKVFNWLDKTEKRLDTNRDAKVSPEEFERGKKFLGHQLKDVADIAHKDYANLKRRYGNDPHAWSYAEYQRLRQWKEDGRKNQSFRLAFQWLPTDGFKRIEFSEALKTTLDQAFLDYKSKQPACNPAKCLEIEAWLYTKLGIALRLQDRFEEALENFDRAIEIDANDLIAGVNRSTVLYGLNREEEALQELRVQIDKVDGIIKNAKVGNRYDSHRLLVHYRLAVYSDNLGRPHEAREQYQKILKSSSNDFIPESYEGLGRLLFREGKLVEAIQHYDLSIRQNPKRPSGYELKGLALHQSGKYEEAVHSYQKSLELMPEGRRNDRVSQKLGWLNDSDLHYRLGLSLAALCRDEEAIASYEQALKLSPQRPDALEALNQLRSKSCKVKSDQGAKLRTAMSAHAYGHLGRSAFEQGDLAAARHYYQQAMEAYEKELFDPKNQAPETRRQLRSEQSEVQGRLLEIRSTLKK